MHLNAVNALPLQSDLGCSSPSFVGPLFPRRGVKLVLAPRIHTHQDAEALRSL